MAQALRCRFLKEPPGLVSNPMLTRPPLQKYSCSALLSDVSRGYPLGYVPCLGSVFVMWRDETSTFKM